MLQNSKNNLSSIYILVNKKIISYELYDLNSNKLLSYTLKIT